MYFFRNPMCFTNSLPYLNKEEKERRNQFEDRWGSTNIFTQRLHYLCKYRYVDNWERELNEDYNINPQCLSTLLWNCREKYKIIYNISYVLPFLQEQVMKDFHFNIMSYYRGTHIQYIFKRRLQ